MVKFLSIKRYLLLFAGIATTVMVMAVPKRNLPITVVQPDGTKVDCFASGDEFHNWLHDANGYTIIQNPKTGYYVYAVEESGTLNATDLVVGKINPAETKSLKPNANISMELYRLKRESKRVNNHFINLNSNTKGVKGIAPLDTYAATATMNNIVVFIKFSDDTPDAEDISYYENIYNNAESSVTDYYSKVSYGRFAVSTTFYPASSGGYVTWYTDSQKRDYYRPYNAVTNTIGYDPDIVSATNPNGQTYREHTLLKNAVNAISAMVPAGLNLDTNNDGYVDVVSFIVDGTNDSWNDLLWPHQWSLYSQTAFINGKQVGDYTLQLQFFGSQRIDLGTLCHEMFHIVGAPDLYHYSENSNISPVGAWDIMEGTLDYPQNMGAYMKYLYGGWIDNIPEISQSGTYTLYPLSTSSAQNCYKIPSPNSYLEYFLVEYRKKNSYDADLPGNGMLVYRINSTYEGVGNSDGPPDEVYIYRPNGNLLINGMINNATFNADYGRTEINDQTNPQGFLADGTSGGLKISNVTSAGEAISFDVDIDFIPSVVLKNDKGLYSSIGTTSNATYRVATRFTTDDLTGLVGRKIVKVDFYLNGADVTSNEVVNVWEGGSYGNPGTLVYTHDVSAEVKHNEWTSHTLTQPVEIKANKEYWAGYSVDISSGYPIAIDGGPMVDGKGAWIYWSNTWKQLTDVNPSFSYNFLIRAVVGPSTTAVDIIPDSDFNVSMFPNPAADLAYFKVNLPESGTLSIGIFNMLGQKVDEVTKKQYDTGNFTIPYNSARLSKGIYMYAITYSFGLQQKRIVDKFIVR